MKIEQGRAQKCYEGMGLSPPPSPKPSSGKIQEMACLGENHDVMGNFVGGKYGIPKLTGINPAGKPSTDGFIKPLSRYPAQNQTHTNLETAEEI